MQISTFQGKRGQKNIDPFPMENKEIGLVQGISLKASNFLYRARTLNVTMKKKDPDFKISLANEAKLRRLPATVQAKKGDLTGDRGETDIGNRGKRIKFPHIAVPSSDP